MTIQNLRKDTRIDAHLPVLLRRGRATLTVETSDISFRGLFLRTKEPPPLRSLVRIDVTLPAHVVETHAMVVHILEHGDREAGVGLQFWGLSGPDRQAWDAHVRELVAVTRASAKAANANAAANVTADAETAATSNGGEPSVASGVRPTPAALSRPESARPAKRESSSGRR